MRALKIRKILLACGTISVALYVATVVLAPLRWDGYNPTSQTVSELIAIDAPTTSLVVPLFVTYSLLVFAFGLGVWLSAGQKHALRFVAIGLIGKEALGLVVTLFFPMHLRGVATTTSDTLHGTLTMVGVLFMLLALGFAAAAFGKWFRNYSIGTILILVVFGILAGMQSPQLAANLPTPWLGIFERINIFGYMLWVVILDLLLLRADTNETR